MKNSRLFKTLVFFLICSLLTGSLPAFADGANTKAWKIIGSIRKKQVAAKTDSPAQDNKAAVKEVDTSKKAAVSKSADKSGSMEKDEALLRLSPRKRAIIERNKVELPEYDPTKVKPLNLDLNDAVKLALAKNARLRVAKAQIREAEGAYEEAKSAMNFKLDATANYTRLDPVGEAELKLGDGPPTKIKFGANNNYSGRAVLSKVLTTFGKLEYSIASAFLKVEVQKGNMAVVQEDIVYGVKEAYYNLLKNKGLLKVAGENLQIVKERKRITDEMFNAGVVPRYEVLRAELAVSKSEQAVVSADNGVRLSKAALLNAIGVDVNSPITIKDDRHVRLIHADLAAAQKKAMDNRPEVKAAVTAMQATKLMVEAVKRGQSPTLAFQSSCEVKNAAGLGATGYSWTNSLVLSIPLFDGGETKARVKQLEEVMKQLDGNLETLARGIMLEVKNSVLTLKRIEANMKAAQKDVETAKEGYSIALVRYENGLSTGLELDDARNTLNTAKINLLNTIYEYETAIAQLEKATAVSWKGDK